MTQLEKARAMKCFGKFLENVLLDPDPKAKDELIEEYNCENCNNHKYCVLLAKTV